MQGEWGAFLRQSGTCDVTHTHTSQPAFIFVSFDFEPHADRYLGVISQVLVAAELERRTRLAAHGFLDAVWPYSLLCASKILILLRTVDWCVWSTAAEQVELC